MVCPVCRHTLTGYEYVDHWVQSHRDSVVIWLWKNIEKLFHGILFY